MYPSGSGRDNFAPKGPFWQCLETVLAVTTEIYEWRPGLLLNILQYTGQPPTTEDYPVQTVNSAEVEKPWSIPSTQDCSDPFIPTNLGCTTVCSEGGDI